MKKVLLISLKEKNKALTGDYAVYLEAFLPAIPNKGDILQIGETNKQVLYKVKEVCYTQEPDQTFAVVVTLTKAGSRD